MSETTYEYEPDTLDEHGEVVRRGRLIRSVTVHDPLWTEEDLGWAMAERANANSLCPTGCGHYLDETTDPALEGEWEVPTPTVCFACRELEKAKAPYQADDVDPGHLFHVRRRQR
ncbi:hypothetical protein GCM10009530_63870 [Microbispora corallina]|uniref:DksA C4-type domain-containing protein n=1 Tax=Microbispora corallina TaxID=83302 RepID=A0ABQ4GC56_9ACTN|nr:hypothetical protein Mco01_76100 [Microbispora corallina]